LGDEWQRDSHEPAEKAGQRCCAKRSCETICEGAIQREQAKKGDVVDKCRREAQSPEGGHGETGQWKRFGERGDAVGWIKERGGPIASKEVGRPIGCPPQAPEAEQ